MATNPSKHHLKIKAGTLHVTDPSGQSVQGRLESWAWISHRLAIVTIKFAQRNSRYTVWAENQAPGEYRRLQVWLWWNQAGYGTKLL